MKAVVGVDWSEQSFAAVRQVLDLYLPREISLVHGADLGFFEYPLVAEVTNMQGYDEFRQAMLDAGTQLIEQIAPTIPPEVESVKRVCAIAKPASLILDTAKSEAADLIVVGARGRGRMTELVLGSVSHRVLLHAESSTLVVKGSARPIRRVLVAVEGREDAQRIQSWLHAHHFRQHMELCVFSVVQPIPVTDTFSMLPVQAWTDTSMHHAEDLVKSTASALMDAHFTLSTQVSTGDPAVSVAQQAGGYDLLVIGSHGRKGLDRFLLGSVSHSIVHRVACPVLVVR